VIEDLIGRDRLPFKSNMALTAEGHMDLEMTSNRSRNCTGGRGLRVSGTGKLMVLCFIVACLLTAVVDWRWASYRNRAQFLLVERDLFLRARTLTQEEIDHFKAVRGQHDGDFDLRCASERLKTFESELERIDRELRAW
jgi:hypothetical protein